MKHRYFSCLFSLCCCSLGIVHSASAQVGCGDYKIKEAQDSYNEGNFNKVFALLKPCLGYGGFSKDNTSLAYKLMSLTYLALDSTERASQSIEQMLSYNPNYEPETELLLPYRFVNLVNRVKQTQARVVQVTSVSKKPEDLYKAPATAMVISEEDIRRRGYTDLEILFNDLPGFDVTRSYGLTYSNIYQRGYRSDNTERTLFMINGIEENDFWSNIAYWSVQVPITNVKRVEVVYGPASTMYGANSFLGVINVITKTPKEMLTGPGNAILKADMGYGSYNTRYADVTTAARIQNISFSVTGRAYYSTLNDLSGYAEYDYNPDDFNTTDYATLFRISQNGKRYSDIYGLKGPYFSLNGNTLTLTPAGVEAARAYDKRAMTKNVNGAPIGYSNLLKSFYVRANVVINDFNMGYQIWRMDQASTNAGTDLSRAGVKNGSVWIPMQSLFYNTYTREIIKDKLVLINTTQYRTSSVNDRSRAVTLRNYSTRTLPLAPLTQSVKDSLAALPTGTQAQFATNVLPASVRMAYNLVNNAQPYWETQYFFQHSDQFRNEIRVIASPANHLDVIGGLEFRNSGLQGDYKQLVDTSSSPIYRSAEEYGRSSLDTAQGGNMFRYRNIGAFVQGTYSPLPALQFVFGGRFDYARIRRSGGYGRVFNPRLAIVYTPGHFAFKAIYAEAFQDASSRDRYALASTRLLNNPALLPDRIRNFELAANYVPNPDLQIGLSAYYALCSNIVEEVSVAYRSGTTLQKQNTGEADIFGIQAMADYKLSERFTFYANATYTNAHRTVTTVVAGRNETVRLVTGDIAPYHFNAGVNALLLKDRLNVNVRFNYVAARPVGKNTSVPDNPVGRNPADQASTGPGGYFAAYKLFNSAITYQINKYLDVQLIIHNMLNEQYSDPGGRSANGVSQAYRTPQKGLNGMIRVMINL
ncbi:hypothetical protein GCM10023189_45980 [Nibrella saemangeumensis]|uniref:TonB-dependent receptor plug domain-containing protein n=1 Tax=Nibrella saemangeumensis TaxID=1084526 RepID=A0ABP8NGC7_9BACT